MSKSKSQLHDDGRIPISIKNTWDYRPTVKGNVQSKGKSDDHRTIKLSVQGEEDERPKNITPIFKFHTEDNHVQRGTEGPLVIDFIRRRNEGALLVSGIEG